MAVLFLVVMGVSLACLALVGWWFDRDVRSGAPRNKKAEKLFAALSILACAVIFVSVGVALWRANSTDDDGTRCGWDRIAEMDPCLEEQGVDPDPRDN